MEFNELQLRRSLIDRDIPLRMHGGLIRWIMHGVQPGHFLTAILQNDLRESINRADHENRDLLVAYIKFLYNDAPSNCWGSKEKMEAWAQHRGLDNTTNIELSMQDVDNIVEHDGGE